MNRAALLVLALLTLAGCRTPVEAPPAVEGDVERREVYQTIANALPRASFGWGEPPGIVEMAKSTKDEGPAPEVQPEKSTERGMRLVIHVYRPRNVWIPYEAIAEAAYEYKAMPNALFIPLIVVPIQATRATVVVDTAKLEGFSDELEADLKRLESISREIGLGGPWSHAQGIRGQIAEDEAAYGKGKLALHFEYVHMIPPWIPYTGPAQETAEALAWAAANPLAPELDDGKKKEEAEDSKGEDSLDDLGGY